MYFRHADQDDVNLLVDLCRRTFFDAFAANNDPADMADYLASAFSMEAIQTELQVPDATFLLGYQTLDSATPVGYAHLVAEAIPDTTDAETVCAANALHLSRLYLEQDAIGKRYGSQLMKACLDYAVKGGFEALWLGVWENNLRARRFYERWGFVQAGTTEFVIGKDIQTDLILVRSTKY